MTACKGTALKKNRLNEIAKHSFLKKVNKRDKFFLPKGALMISGAIYTNLTDSFGNPISRIKFQEMGVIFPSNNFYTASVDSILFEHKLEFFEEGDKGQPIVGFDTISRMSRLNVREDEEESQSNIIDMIKDEAIVTYSP